MGFELALYLWWVIFYRIYKYLMLANWLFNFLTWKALIGFVKNLFYEAIQLLQHLEPGVIYAVIVKKTPFRCDISVTKHTQWGRALWLIKMKHSPIALANETTMSSITISLYVWAGHCCVDQNYRVVRPVKQNSRSKYI